MTCETIILTSVEASVPVSWNRPRGAARSRRSEGERIFDLLERATALDSEARIGVGNRKYRIAPFAKASGGSRWVEQPDGGCLGKIILALADSDESVSLDFKLTKEAHGRKGKLTLTCDPAAMLVGYDAHPTIARLDTKKIVPFPSSSWWVNDAMFSLGFKFLAALHNWLDEQEGPVFGAETQTAIDDGQIRVAQLSWVADLPARDPASFLRLLPAMYGHTIGDGDSYVQLASHLGLKFEFRPDSKRNAVADVTLKKLHGRKPLYTIRFSNYEHDADQTSANNGVAVAEAEAVPKYVRLKVTAHGDGVAAILSKARQRLESLQKVDPGWLAELDGESLKPDPTPTARQVADAIWVLSEGRDRSLFRSFAGWLVAEMLNNVLRLNVLSRFKQENLQALITLDDSIATAWRDAAPCGDQNWAEAIASKVGKTAKTVRNRRKEWLSRYDVDVSIAYSFYSDLLLFGSTSQASPKDRAMLTASMSGTDKARALEVLDGAWRDFERQRLAMTSTLTGPIKEIRLEPVRPRFRTDRTPLRHAKRLTAPVERLTRPAKAVAANAKTGLSKRSRPNKGRPVLPQSKTATKSAAKKAKRFPARGK
jgi:hypothetical protein